MLESASKICFKCSLDKPLSQFYRHSKAKDGHLGKCKDCAKSDTKKNRHNNKDYYAEYDKQRFKNDPKVKARHEKYKKTQAGKDALLRSNRKWRKNNPVKAKSHILLNGALKNGEISKPETCSDCGVSCSPHGHHYDYDRPLDVVWLCSSCHRYIHNEIDELNLDLMNPEHKQLINQYREKKHGRL